MIKYILIIFSVLFIFVLIAFLIINKKLKKSEVAQIRKLRKASEAKSFSSEMLFQKLYVFYSKIPFLKRYLLKLRRRLTIINVEDEYLTRRQAAKILTNSLLTIIPLTLAIIIITHKDILLLAILLLFELFMVDTFLDSKVNKIDNNLLRSQIEFFAKIRHAYYEYNMVEEAIYQVAQDDDKPEMSRQAEKIYEVLISDDPEGELEKYYDIAPNIFLKEFAGISYLTKEYGDRKINNASLYLKSLNNITQEMQLEILKRDKLDYVFQSLLLIAIVPILGIQPIKMWATSQFSFTAAFYNGKLGFIIQILILVLTFVCYILIRKLKENSSTTMTVKNTENPWQEKVYNVPVIKQFVNLFIPKPGTKEDRKLKQDIKDAASKDKISWIFVNRLSLFAITFILSIFLFHHLHAITIKGIYNDPTNDYDILGQMSEEDTQRAMKLTKSDNQYLDYFRGKTKTTQQDIEKIMREGKVNEDYNKSTDEKISIAATRVLKKLKVIHSNNLSWFDFLLSIVFSIIAYMTPILLLKFQIKVRQLEMEDEVMQFNTIILMLMRIERINVEIILEWLERYSNFFKEPISKCVNNYESGAWEALEELKEDVSYQPFIRIVESLQSAVEKIPIADAFDELDTERDYYQAKRKETNDRLIERKGRLGKIIGFAPMVVLFLGYLIIPLVGIGMTSMHSTFNTIGADATKVE